MIEKIISGGQTGADVAALDWAIKHGVPHGGWCPKGRICESGTIDPKYNLQETDSTNYLVRTEKNILESDATIIFSMDKLSGGSLATMRIAAKHNKPYVAVYNNGNLMPDLHRFVILNRPKVLNVAGSRQSKAAKISTLVSIGLDILWAHGFIYGAS